ncbi:hypothetical protein QC761_605330 [Podospora bellae-mahoneyi]|uniref:Uncharacterized protein n=1 Tax=Podospora bellae-mahoneyi TaxID=2093777 RepID=A0ABR0F8F1_9PEZI|nr:hypothetical protein QC761_605330 [Podospora bellae-mahoneyi]
MPIVSSLIPRMDFFPLTTNKVPVIVPCGCTRASVAPTTTSICPTASDCQQCTTSWGIYVTTQSNCALNARVTGRAEANDAHRWKEEGMARYARLLRA